MAAWGYKGRLVACGNEKVYRLDFIDTFSAVLDMTTGRVVFVMARVWGVPVRHGDFPNANVKAKKEEDLEILMHITQGMVISVETWLRSV